MRVERDCRVSWTVPCAVFGRRRVPKCLRTVVLSIELCGFRWSGSATRLEPPKTGLAMVRRSVLAGMSPMKFQRVGSRSESPLMVPLSRLRRRSEGSERVRRVHWQTQQTAWIGTLLSGEQTQRGHMRPGTMFWSCTGQNCGTTHSVNSESTSCRVKRRLCHCRKGQAHHTNNSVRLFGETCPSPYNQGPNARPPTSGEANCAGPRQDRTESTARSRTWNKSSRTLRPVREAAGSPWRSVLATWRDFSAMDRASVHQDSGCPKTGSIRQRQLGLNSGDSFCTRRKLWGLSKRVSELALAVHPSTQQWWSACGRIPSQFFKETWSSWSEKNKAFPSFRLTFRLLGPLLQALCLRLRRGGCRGARSSTPKKKRRRRIPEQPAQVEVDDE